MKLKKEIGLGKREKKRKKNNCHISSVEEERRKRKQKSRGKKEGGEVTVVGIPAGGRVGPQQLSINIPAVERALHPSPLLLFVRLLEDRSSTLASLHSGSSTLPPPPLSLYRFGYRRWLEEEEPRGEEGKEVGV